MITKEMLDKLESDAGNADFYRERLAVPPVVIRDLITSARELATVKAELASLRESSPAKARELWSYIYDQFPETVGHIPLDIKLAAIARELDKGNASRIELERVRGLSASIQWDNRVSRFDIIVPIFDKKAAYSESIGTLGQALDAIEKEGK